MVPRHSGQVTALGYCRSGALRKYDAGKDHASKIELDRKGGQKKKKEGGSHVTGFNITRLLIFPIPDLKTVER